MSDRYICYPIDEVVDAPVVAVCDSEEDAEFVARACDSYASMLAALVECQRVLAIELPEVYGVKHAATLVSVCDAITRARRQA